MCPLPFQNKQKRNLFLLVSQDIDLARGRSSGSEFVFGVFERVTSWLSMRCPSPWAVLMFSPISYLVDISAVCTRRTASAEEIDIWLYLKPYLTQETIFLTSHCSYCDHWDTALSSGTSFSFSVSICVFCKGPFRLERHREEGRW